MDSIDEKQEKENTSDPVQKLLETSITLFSEKGYSNTSIRDIAKHSEVGLSGIYYYFKNKEDLLFNILKLSMARFYDEIKTSICADADPKDNIIRIIEALMKMVYVNRKEFGLTITESYRLSPMELNIINEEKKNLHLLIRNELARLQDQGELQDLNLTVITSLLIGMVAWTFFWFNPEGTITIEELTTVITKLFFGGVLK